MNVPLLDLKAQYATIKDEVRAAVDGVLESQRFVLGPNVQALEREIADFCQVPHAVAVASGTDALLLSLKALGVGPGCSVITVPFTFFATAGAIVNVGARPLFVDIEAAGYAMDPARLSDLLGTQCRVNSASGRLVHLASNTEVKALLPVHLYGQCAEMDEIRQLARRYRLPIVEDACQALGARYRGEAAGTMGDFGCISFFPSKNLGGAGDGGMIIARDGELATRARLLRTHGGERKYFHAVVGYNSRLDELQAAILRVKLRRLNDWNGARREHAAAYGSEFRAAGLGPAVRLPEVLPGREHIFHQYVIRCRRRDDLRAYLTSKEIGTEVYYPLALHEQECFRPLGYRPSDFPCAADAAREVLALPVYPELSAGQRAHVVRSLTEFYASDGPDHL